MADPGATDPGLEDPGATDTAVPDSGEPDPGTSDTADIAETPDLPVPECKVAADCPPPGSMCRSVDCIDGHCIEADLQDGTSCDDGNLCTLDDTCEAGACKAGSPLECPAPQPCHELVACDPKNGKCAYQPLPDDTPCDDGNACSEPDVCKQGVCLSTPKSCDDGDPCTVDACDAGVCKHAAIVGCIPEVCDNLADDNENGLIDCDDPHCLQSAACDSPAGDFCAKALPVADGKPVGKALAGQTLTYTGDTTGRRHDYQGDCTMPAEVPDVVYRLDLAEPMRVTVSHDFDSLANEGPWAVVLLFADACRADSLADCATGEAGAATIERTLAAGTWFIVVDGESFWDKDWGPYTLRISFAAPPVTETVCSDDIDDDADGWTDCIDPDCAASPACKACPIVAEVTCGDTIVGTLASAEHEMHYRFKAPKAETVYFVGVDTGVTTDYLNFNFYEFKTGKACDELYNVGGTITHVQPNTAYFKTKAGQDIVIKVLVTNYKTGAFSFSIACGVAPETACADTKDNDMDGYMDCEDSDCFGNTACTGGHSGETCVDPYRVNGGTAVTAAAAGLQGVTFTYWNTTEDRGKDLAAACSTASKLGRDTVYQFTLAERLAVGVTVENEDFLQSPVVYVFSGACTADSLLGCGQTIFGLSWWGATLEAGTYYAVVDAGAIGIDGIPDASDYTITFSFENPAPAEICGNGADEDEDGKTDCQDPECFKDAACTSGHTGETCTDPIPMSAVALVAGTTYTAWNTTIGAKNDLSGACSVYSEAGPDRVHGFSLTTAATVTVTAQFEDGFTPALMLFDGVSCQPENLKACVVADWDTAMLTVALEPGQYRVVVDSGDALFAEPMAQNYTLTLQVK